MLSLEEVEAIWTPYVVFENTKYSEGTEVDNRSHLSVLRRGRFTRSGMDVVEEIYIFPGSENPITFEAIYTKKFSCNYQLALYPFDTQVRSRTTTVTCHRAVQ